MSTDAVGDRDEYVEKLGHELGAALHFLKDDLYYLRLKWRDYVALFGTSPPRIKLLNASAPWFFWMLENELFDNALLHLSRMTDPPKIGRHAAMGIRRLASMVDPALQADLEPLIERADESTLAVRNWRDRTISHRDFNYFLNPKAEPLPPISRQVVVDAIEAVHAVLDLAHVRLMGFALWPLPADTNPGAEALLHVIRDGLDRMQEQERRIAAGEIDYSDLWRPIE